MPPNTALQLSFVVRRQSSDVDTETLTKMVQRLVEVHGEALESASETQRVFVYVYAAQGVIDNGGFQYFFESDWPGKPSYDVFVSAYRGVGLADQAEVLGRAASIFPFPQPHLSMEKRNEYLDAHGVPKNLDTLCGDRQVWIALVKYAQLHEEALRA